MVITLTLACAGQALAESCIAPERPFVPSDPVAVKELKEIILGDFELYITEVQRYFRCLDDERSRAFSEAQAVSQEYQDFLKVVSQ